MKKSLIIVYLFVGFLIISFSNNLLGQNNNSERIILKDNGRIILAYKVFEDFLNSDKSWESYKSIVLEAYPEMQAAHNP